MSKHIRFHFLLWLFSFGFQHGVFGAYTGKIALNDSWNGVAYLSLIPAFEEMYTLNKDFIVGTARLDAQGSFQFSTEILPQQASLYRVHFVKKEDPTATLIMGGPHENHFFFVAGRNDALRMELLDRDQPISSTDITGAGVNTVIAEINQYQHTYQQMNGENPALKAQLLDRAYEEQLMVIADTTEYYMAGLYAIYQGNLYKNRINHPEVYESFLERWKEQKSPYMLDFAKQLNLPSKEASSALPLLLAVFLGMLLGGAGVYLVLNKRSVAQNVPVVEDNVALLSVQEKKIYRLLQQGMSNKEISMEHNIGINTVKSHVSSILSKMKVKSRKEIMS